MLSQSAVAEADGRWYSTVGISSGALRFDVSSASNASGSSAEKLAIRRGFRGSQYVVQARVPIALSDSTGILLHYQDSENYMAVIFAGGSTTATPQLIRRKAGAWNTIYSGTAFTMTSGDTVKCVIGSDGAGGQRLNVYVNGTARISNRDEIDNTWLGGAVGLIVRPNASQAFSFDDFKVGYDNDSNGSIDDAGDDVQIDDDFASAQMTLTHDHNGNLTDDGIFKFVYDAWNRLVKAKHRSAGNAATIATYAYDGAMRRVSQALANSGPEATLGDGGNRTSHYYFAGTRGRTGASPVEERNGSSQLVRAYLNGAQPGDLLWAELNGDVTIGDDTSPDNTATGEGSESPADKRYFLHQDRARRIATITEYDTAGTNNGRVAERKSHVQGRNRLVITGNGGSEELSTSCFASRIVPEQIGTGTMNRRLSQSRSSGRVGGSGCSTCGNSNFAALSVSTPPETESPQDGPTSGPNSGPTSKPSPWVPPPWIQCILACSSLCQSEPGSLGGVTCSPWGTKCLCVCTNNIDRIFPNTTAASIITTCVARHEQYNYDHTGQCRKTWNPPPYHGDFVDPPMFDPECYGFQEAMKCIEEQMEDCGSDRDCYCDLLRMVSHFNCDRSGCNSLSKQECKDKQQAMITILTPLCQGGGGESE